MDYIPIEKSKRVIYLEKRRGKSAQRGWINFTAGVLFVVALLCFLYCAGVFCVGFGTYFFLIWGVIGVLCLCLGWLLRHPNKLVAIPRWVRRMFMGIFLVGMLCFCLVEGMILAEFQSEPISGADYCVILGAQWKTTGPGDVLRRRLDAAIDYLEENAETMVIVTGGQGDNEIIPEGVGMKQYLMENGIKETRILVEDNATNTCENLMYSAEFLNPEEDSVVLVTSNFHVFRAVKIAQKQGYEKVSGLAADSMAGLLPNNLLREFLGVVKDFIIGNM